MTERSWVQTPTMETIFQAPFIWIKAWNKNWKTLTWHCCMCCNPANGRVDFVELSAYKIQLHGTEWIVSLSANWDQSPTTTKKILWSWQFTNFNCSKIGKCEIIKIFFILFVSVLSNPTNLKGLTYLFC
jgi:hypothetical protein